MAEQEGNDPAAEQQAGHEGIEGHTASKGTGCADECEPGRAVLASHGSPGQ